MSTKLHSFLEAPAISQFPSSFRLLAKFNSLQLVVGLRSFALGGFPHSFSCLPCNFPPAVALACFESLWRSFLLRYSALNWREFSPFKGSYDKIGATEVIQDNFPVSRSITLMTPGKSFFFFFFLAFNNICIGSRDQGAGTLDMHRNGEAWVYTQATHSNY